METRVSVTTTSSAAVSNGCWRQFCFGRVPEKILRRSSDGSLAIGHRFCLFDPMWHQEHICSLGGLAMVTHLIAGFIGSKLVYKTGEGFVLDIVLGSWAPSSRAGYSASSPCTG